MNGWYFDIESDGFYLQSKTIWYIKFKTLDNTRSMSVYPFKEDCKTKILEWIKSFEDGALVVQHNGLGFDTWMLWKFFGIQPQVGKKGKDWLGAKHVQFVDTLVLSQYLQPDSLSHSLAYLSSGNDNEKIDYRKHLIETGVMPKDSPKGFEFSFYNEYMDTYCDADVDAGIAVFNKLWKLAQEMYGMSNWIHPSFKQIQKDYFLYQAQAYTGVKFNVERAKKLVENVTVEMDRIKKEVDCVLPNRGLKESEKSLYKIPAKPFKANGDYSTTFTTWLSKHNAKVIDGKIHAYGLITDIKANEVLDVKIPMEIDDNAELKQWFMENGWRPSEEHWNLKKGEDGKPLRENGKVIKTTPKIMVMGNICPNLLRMEAEIPAKVVKYLSYRNRRSVVEGWLNNWRIGFDGRLSAEISGYTPTFRVRHRTVVNCPKADPKVLLGAEMRDLFCVDDGNWYIGTDSAALENRTLAAYTMKHDNGAFAELILRGDSHSFNSFAFFPEIASKFDINTVGLKDLPEFKPYRNKAKTGAYLLAYGGGVAKLASSLGLSKQAAQVAYDNYWTANYGLGKLKDAAEKYYDTVGKKKHLPAWDGRILSIRRKNVLINCLGQSLGAICQSLAACLMDAKLGKMYIDDMGRPYYLYKGKMVKRLSLVHDEYSWEAEDGIEEDIRAMSVKCIIEAGEFLKLPIELDGEGKMSKDGSWKDVH